MSHIGGGKYVVGAGDGLSFVGTAVTVGTSVGLGVLGVVGTFVAVGAGDGAFFWQDKG